MRKSNVSAPDFFAAVEAGDEAAVRSFLEQDPALVAAIDPRPRPNFDQVSPKLVGSGLNLAPSKPQPAPEHTALHLAICSNHLEIARLLVAHGANIMVKTRPSQTPLQAALYSGDAHFMAFLLECLLKTGFNVNTALNQQGSTLLDLIALRLEHPWNADFDPIIETLLRHGADFNPGARGAAKVDPPLVLAAMQGCIGVARLLLQAGADPNAKSRYGESAIHFAVRHGSSDVVELLLQAGADPSAAGGRAKAAWEFTQPFEHALVIVEGFLKTAEQNTNRLVRNTQRSLAPWLERGGIQAEFLTACLASNLDKARQLLQEDPSLANLPSGEVTPLRLAASYGHSELAELLIQHGAEVNSPASSDMNYPLHLAARSGHTPVLQLLIRHEADLNAVDRGHRTPLHAAARANSKEAIRLLIEAGANREIRSLHEDCTALQEALSSDGGESAVRELVRLGADVNAETSKKPHLWFRILSENQWPLLGHAEGTRPLHMAVCERKPHIVELLLDHGADINALSFGWSALHAAVAMPDHAMIELLLRRGADPPVKANLKSLRGPAWNHQTPMDFLSRFRRIAELLEQRPNK